MEFPVPRMCLCISGDRLFLLNVGNLSKSYYPAGKVDPFWLNIKLGDTVACMLFTPSVNACCKLPCDHTRYSESQKDFNHKVPRS